MSLLKRALLNSYFGMGDQLLYTVYFYEWSCNNEFFNLTLPINVVVDLGGLR